MKIAFHCAQCTEGPKPKHVFLHADLRDDGAYSLGCRNGHRFVSVLQNPQFELLFDSAALALRDDYLREAVASFAAALESFWALYVRIAARKLGSPPEAIEQLRKDLKLSERRIGAMHLAHLLLTGTSYAHDVRKRREFRNEVVHDGRFPSRSEATDYGSYVFAALTDGIEELRMHAEAAATDELNAQTVAAHQKLASEAVRFRQSRWVQTIVSFMNYRRGMTFEQVIHFWNDNNVWDLFGAEAKAAEPDDDDDEAS